MAPRSASPSLRPAHGNAVAAIRPAASLCVVVLLFAWLVPLSAAVSSQTAQASASASASASLPLPRRSTRHPRGLLADPVTKLETQPSLRQPGVQPGFPDRTSETASVKTSTDTDNRKNLKGLRGSHGSVAASAATTNPHLIKAIFGKAEPAADETSTKEPSTARESSPLVAASFSKQDAWSVIVNTLRRSAIVGASYGEEGSQQIVVLLHTPETIQPALERISALEIPSSALPVMCLISSPKLSRTGPAGAEPSEKSQEQLQDERSRKERLPLLGLSASGRKAYVRCPAPAFQHSRDDVLTVEIEPISEASVDTILPSPVKMSTLRVGQPHA